MASQHIQVVAPPSKDATVQAFLQNMRAHNEPGSVPLVFGGGQLHAEMPFLLNVPGAPLPCREPAADFEAVNAHFSAQVHAFFNGLHEIEDMAAKQSPDEPALIDADRGLQPAIRIGNQVIESEPDVWGGDRKCLHRAFHSRRLTVQKIDSLPVLNHVTELLIVPEEAFTGNPFGMRPVSMRTPLDLATRLPQLRRLLCPWLWEYFPIPFTSKALRIISRVWAGPWRDDRAEFARGHLRIKFHPCAPDGSWYFSGPRGEDPYPIGFAITREEHYPSGQEDDNETHELMSEEEDEYWDDAPDIYELRQPDMFRIRPIAERVNPLLLAFALSLQRQAMPSLQDAELFTWLTWRPSKERAEEYEGSDEVPPSSGVEGISIMFRWGVRYEAPAAGGDRKGKVIWYIGDDWRPGDEVMRAFKDLVGGQGGEGNMEWKEFKFVEEREQDPEDFL
ncbi:hypothetical protein NEMBOFW57_010249 [Staphylotrichum longicolle]|uniref:Uncharacterized protein n=1 Tax=Staphylotrichum longicolle TaxID=669026 RepID=A0AAD4ER05_9PEZI|nr:hypothetical protein NEMBOFW57_010249 [Staphylotrichum longicolle]